ncbi:energy-coupling factor transporter transmembrane component T family protein [Nonomuraea sediminis]|uniref:energy-coupling factor transporter transmembrane component T family protein n=1 Tax=Nonomuraea sediminis TaxID=2835864 RepID=UPI001BDBFB0F|nr:energy-coupling factor transporter transmembrane component T [Nonomuraea sediminis]
MSVGFKLLGLAVGCTVLVLLRSPYALAEASVFVALLYWLSGAGLKAAWGQIRPLRWFAVLLFCSQLLFADLPTAISSTLRVVLAVALAGLVTLTTPTSELLAWLDRRGVPPRVSLLLSLTLRSVPVMTELAVRVREAQRARGVERSVRAFAVPLLVSALRHADALGEALNARGVDD